jgi:hypothetical protein
MLEAAERQHFATEAAGLRVEVLIRADDLECAQRAALSARQVHLAHPTRTQRT